ncbi:MAG: shikimate dehydrogenase [Gammaproteobacteria bacterium RIFCSPHIGHO2_12_FULL_45_9]|nr:MAG: shikimate dehydrogenase [Gammaproteobacteria bacterium RIFCSPHIGHO2_12_FULL_45_9]
MDHYAVFGNPIAHSLSPDIHTQFAQLTGHTLSYTRILVAPGELQKALTDFAESGGRGANITVPFKTEALQLCTRATPLAIEAGACNCISFHASEWVADCTDGLGLVYDLTQQLQLSLAQKRILIVGCGGATRGIIGPLLAEHPTEIVLINRTMQKAEQLAESFQSHGTLSACPWHTVLFSEFDFIIHATSLGHTGQLPDLPPTTLSPTTWVYDLSYGKAAEPFLQWAITAGARHYTDGLGMLVAQAAFSFERWRGIMPPVKPVLAAMRNR